VSDPPVPRPLQIAAAWSWRLLLVGGAIVGLVLAAAQLRLVVLPVMLAIVLAALLSPVVRLVGRSGMPHGLAVGLTIIASLVVLGGLVTLMAPRAIDEFAELDVSVQDGIETVQGWLVDGPLGLSERQIESTTERAIDEVRSNAGVISQGAVTGAFLLVEVLAGLSLALVILFFFLKDGTRIWAWIVGLFHRERQDDVREMGDRAWTTLGGYLRGVTMVATFDAVFIGLALILLGVPLVLPLVMLTFFGAYLPVVGAVLAGLAAVMVALVSEGVVTALLVLAAVVFVQQVESNFFQPVVVGRSVHLHPVVILLALTAGGVLGGLIGALLATPLVAVLNSMLVYLREKTEVERVVGATPADRREQPGEGGAREEVGAGRAG
jgi:putative heme transporter